MVSNNLFSHKTNKKSSKVDLKIRKHCFRKLIIKIIETKYEYFNTYSKHFVGSKNPYLLVFVLIWHFSSISLHFNSTDKMHRLLYCTVYCLACTHKITFFSRSYTPKRQQINVQIRQVQTI